MKSVETPPTRQEDSEPKPEKQPITNTKAHKVTQWLLVALIFGGGIALWKVFTPSEVPTAQTPPTQPPPKPVETIALTPGGGTRQIKLLGQVEASETANLSSQIEGTVQKVLVREGDRVTPGRVVAVLDDANPRLALAEAQARLAQERSNLARLQVGTRPEILAQRKAELNTAKARELEAKDNLGRISGLTEEGALSQRALVEAQTAVDAATSERFRTEALLAEAQAGPTKEEIDAQKGLVAAAQAAVEQTKLAMKRTEIKAVASGIVRSREVDPGDYVEVSDPILTLVGDRALEIFLEVPETLSGQVTPGMRVKLTARALPNWQQSASITAVVPTANQSSRRQLVRITLPSPPPKMLPGMAIQADLAMSGTNALTFVVPRDALTRRGDDWLLFTVAENKAQQIAVEVVTDLGKEVVIRDPQLRQGQSIVVRGGDGLSDNAAVKVVNSGSPES